MAIANIYSNGVEKYGVYTHWKTIYLLVVTPLPKYVLNMH